MLTQREHSKKYKPPMRVRAQYEVTAAAAVQCGESDYRKARCPICNAAFVEGEWHLRVFSHSLLVEMVNDRGEKRAGDGVYRIHTRCVHPNAYLHADNRYVQRALTEALAKFASATTQKDTRK